MKGIIFNLLEETVRGVHGEEMWDHLLEAAAVDGSYTSLGSYPDEDLAQLVVAAATALAVPQDEVLRWFGGAAIPLLAERYPRFFRPHESTCSFLLSLNDIIHAEVRKLYPGAEVPVFAFDVRAHDELILEYHSARGLCCLAMGMIEGAARQFGEEATVEQSQCKRPQDGACVFRVALAPRIG